MTIRLNLIFMLILTLPVSGIAADGQPFLDDYDPSYRPDIKESEEWKEGEVEIPPYPNDKNLIEFAIDNPNSSFKYYLDKPSLSVGEDGVVRYTLLIESKTGAKNISFEGVRCNEHEYSIYAYGTQGKFRKVRTPEWISFETDRYNLHRRDLYEFYLCDSSRQVAYPPKVIIDRIKRSSSHTNTTDFY